MTNPRSVIDGLRLFVDREIRPRAAEFDRNGAIPRDLIREMAERGYLAAPFPSEFGGLGLDPLAYGQVTAEVARGCSSVRTLLTVHTSLVGETLIRWGTPQQKARLLPAMARGEILAAFALSEPEVGSNAKAVTTTYSRRGDHFVLNGRKKWISFGVVADILLVLASQAGRTTIFLVDAAKTTRTPIHGLLGVRGSQLAAIDFADVEVSPDDVVGGEGQGFEYVAQTALDFGRASVAWGALGVAQESLEVMMRYARTRRQFDEVIGNFQLIKGILADAVTDVHAACALCERMGARRTNRDLDATIETNIAKYFASRVASRVTSDAVQVLGANGCSDDYPVERMYRDAKVFEIIEGSSQIQQLLIAKFGLNRYGR